MSESRITMYICRRKSEFLFGLSTYKSEAADKKLSSVLYCTVFVYLCIYEYHEIYLKDFQEKMIVSLFHSSFVK
jgi:hypothetical protein